MLWNSRESSVLRWVRGLLLHARPAWQRLVIGLGCIAIATFFRALLGPFVDNGLPFVTFVPAILIASVWGSTLAGSTVMILASLIADYAWIPPAGFDLSPATTTKIGGFWLVGSMLIIIVALLRASVESENRANILADEMQHRVNNLLNVVQLIADQTSRNAPTLAEYGMMFSARLAALAQAQKLVIRNPTMPIDLEALLYSALEPFDPGRFSLSGTPAGVPQDFGPTLVLLIHELGTNALKYGALSVPDGCVSINWTCAEKHVRLDWLEKGGPPVGAPKRTGFGSRLMKSAFRAGRGDGSISFDPGGVHCAIRFPAV